MNQQYQIQLQHLPSEILIRIFGLLSFRQRIRLERVCRQWRQAALALAWLEFRVLKVTNRIKNPLTTRPARSLGKLSAILRRCGPILEELHLGPGIGVQTRFGRYFRHLAAHKKLAHLRIDDSLDVWHLQQISQHLAPQLLSLSINLYSGHRKRKMTKKEAVAIKEAFAELLGNCQKLECLRIRYIADLFMEDESQPGQLIPLLPKSVKYLQIWHEEYWNEMDTEKFRLLLNEEEFPKICFLLCNCQNELNELLGTENSKIYERFYSLQWPMLYAPNNSFLQLNFANFRYLQALQVNANIDYEGLRELAKSCPQLEHLDFQAHYAAGWGEWAPLRNLEGLYAFRRLSSIALAIELRHFENFHELKCTTGEFADEVLMEIITKLDRIHPLRSLDFKAYYRNLCYYPNFHEGYVLQMVQQLRHLETFSCAIEPDYHFQENQLRNEQIRWKNIRIDLDEFFAELINISGEQMVIKKAKCSKIFKFMILESGSHGRPKNCISAKWNPNLGKITWKIIPQICEFNYQIYPANSIVLDEILGQVIDQRIKRIFFEHIQ